MSASRRTPWLVAAALLAVGLGGAWWTMGPASDGDVAEAPARAKARRKAPPGVRPGGTRALREGGLPDDLGVDAEGNPRRPNFLVLLADDVGQDMIGAYGEHPSPPPTPRLDALADEGVMFRQAVANPVCSPTRATLLTGRYSHRYGIGSAIPPREGWGLPDSEVLLPTVLDEVTDGAYASVVVGKWHLATPNMGGWRHPLDEGFDHHVGTMGNLLGRVQGREELMSYTSWTRVEDGVPGAADGYITTATIDDALAFAERLPEPWFMLVAFHAAHFPMHIPPDDLHTSDVQPPAEGEELDETAAYRAMVESLDTEIGRLLDGLGDDLRSRTDVLFLGDNGSAPVGVVEPWLKVQSKGSLLRGGIRVPFVWSGPSVRRPGTETDALVNTTDLFATILELVGSDREPPEDSVSFAHVLADPEAPSRRRFAFAERFTPNGMGPWEEHGVAIRDHRFKLILTNGEPVAMFDLVRDPMETRNLLKLDPPPPFLLKVYKRFRYAMPEGVALDARPGPEEAAMLGVAPEDRL